jgi:thiol-disulfide isomerase/thioredoxin
MGWWALAAGFALFFILLRFFERDRDVRSFWLGRVVMGAVVGVILARLAPLWTRFDDVLSDPLILITAETGLAGLVGGLFAFSGVTLTSLLQLRRVRKDARRWTLLVPVGVGLLLAGGLLLLSARPSGPPETHLSVLDLEGRHHTLAEWKGHVAVVNFWATWCPPCLDELPDLKTFSAASKTVAVVGVDAINLEKQGSSGVLAFASEHQLGWTQLADSEGVLQKAYAVSALPTTVVLDPSGKVVERHEGAVDLAWLGTLEAKYGKP